MQADIPVLAWKYPLEQLVQTEAEMILEYRPEAQFVHTLAEAAEKKPAAQVPETVDNPMESQ